MSENYAFPDRLMLFRRDREMTQGDHFCHDPSDWRWYVRADLYETQSAEITDLQRQLAEARAEVKALRAERDSFRAVLEGAGYGDIDGIAKNTVEQSRLLGETVMHLTLAQITRAKAAEAEVARLREALQTMVDSYEASSELHTSSADCAANLYDRARAALTTKGDTP